VERKMNYIKVLLYVYPRIDSIVRNINGTVLAKALASYSYNETCESVADRILKCISIKDSFMTLGIKTDEILSKLTDKEKYMLEYKYFKR
jgi:citrate lyase synthetase